MEIVYMALSSAHRKPTSNSSPMADNKVSLHPLTPNKDEYTMRIVSTCLWGFMPYSSIQSLLLLLRRRTIPYSQYYYPFLPFMRLRLN